MTSGKLVPHGPFGEVAHILSYGANQTSPHGPQGIASYPWAWLVDRCSARRVREENRFWLVRRAGDS